MSVGTGIFLSSIVAAALFLFLRTRDRWNWKKIAIWFAIIVIAVPAAVSGLMYSYALWQAQPQRQNEFWGVSLQDTEEDVKFKKGVASDTPNQKIGTPQWVYALNSNGSIIPKINKGDIASQVYLVRFAARRVRYVLCIAGDLPTIPKLGGIGSRSSLDDIEETLGQPTYVSRFSDETERWYSFDRYNVAFAFKQGRMSGVGVYDPSSGPVRFDKESK